MPDFKIQCYHTPTSPSQKFTNSTKLHAFVGELVKNWNWLGGQQNMLIFGHCPALKELFSQNNHLIDKDELLKAIILYGKDVNEKLGRELTQELLGAFVYPLVKSYSPSWQSQAHHQSLTNKQILGVVKEWPWDHSEAFEILDGNPSLTVFFRINRRWIDQKLMMKEMLKVWRQHEEDLEETRGDFHHVWSTRQCHAEEIMLAIPLMMDDQGLSHMIEWTGRNAYLPWPFFTRKQLLMFARGKRYDLDWTPLEKITHRILTQQPSYLQEVEIRRISSDPEDEEEQKVPNQIDEFIKDEWWWLIIPSEDVFEEDTLPKYLSMLRRQSMRREEEGNVRYYPIVRALLQNQCLMHKQKHLLMQKKMTLSLSKSMLKPSPQNPLTQIDLQASYGIELGRIVMGQPIPNPDIEALINVEAWKYNRKMRIDRNRLDFKLLDTILDYFRYPERLLIRRQLMAQPHKARLYQDQQRIFPTNTIADFMIREYLLIATFLIKIDSRRCYPDQLSLDEWQGILRWRDYARVYLKNSASPLHQAMRTLWTEEILQLTQRRTWEPVRGAHEKTIEWWVEGHIGFYEHHLTPLNVEVEEREKAIFVPTPLFHPRPDQTKTSKTTSEQKCAKKDKE